MAEGKNSFVLYHDIREPLKLLSDEERGRLFLALLDYSEFGIMPDYDGSLGMAFAFVRTSIDRDSEAWEAKRQKRADAGRKGGQATQANASIAKQNKQRQANQAVPAPVPVPVPVPGRKESKADKPPTRSRFVPPTEEDVQAYIDQQGYTGIDAAAFVDYYAANGWVQGKGKPIKDWRAAVRTWARRESNVGKTGGEQPAGDKWGIQYDV